MKNTTTTRRSAQVGKAVAGMIGLSLVAVETGLNADFAAQGGNWATLAVVAAIVITVGGAAALPIAERIGKSGQWLKAAGLVAVFFPLVLMLSFTAAIERSGSRLDAKVAAHSSTETQKGLAQEALTDAQKVRDRECAKGSGYRCRKAEAAVAEARKGLKSDVTNAAQALEDSMVKRVAALLSFLGVSEKGIELYQPLLMPFALLTGGFLFIAVGFAPRHEPLPPKVEAQEQAAAPFRLTQKDEALERLVALLRSPWAKTNLATGRACAKELGIPESTFARYAAEWVEGKIVARASDGALALPLRRRKA